jgi:hypothetical protein
MTREDSVWGLSEKARRVLQAAAVEAYGKPGVYLVSDRVMGRPSRTQESSGDSGASPSAEVNSRSGGRLRDFRPDHRRPRRSYRLAGSPVPEKASSRHSGE